MFKMFKQSIGVIAAIFMTTGMATAAPVNTDFETGALSPWYQDYNSFGGTDWTITGTSINGSYSAYDFGNKRLRQDFTGISTDDILSVTFNLLTNGHAFNAYNFFYSDLSSTELLLIGVADTVQLKNVTSSLIAGKTLVGFGLYGNSGGSTTFDDFTITVAGDVPEPAALGFLALGLISIVALRRRR